MRNYHHYGIDSLATKGNRLFVTKLVLNVVLGVDCMPEIRASFFWTLLSRRSCRQNQSSHGRNGTHTCVRPGLDCLQQMDWLQQPERLRNALRCAVAVG